MGAVPGIEADALESWLERLRSSGYEVEAVTSDPELPSGIVRKGGRELSLTLLPYTDGTAGVYVNGKDSRRREFVSGIVAALRTEVPTEDR